MLFSLLQSFKTLKKCILVTTTQISDAIEILEKNQEGDGTMCSFHKNSLSYKNLLKEEPRLKFYYYSWLIQTEIWERGKERKDQRAF